MKTVLILAAAGEGVTGLALLMVPSFVGTLLLGDEFSGVALPVARIAGIALIALAIACWPGPARLGSRWRSHLSGPLRRHVTVRGDVHR